MDASGLPDVMMRCMNRPQIYQVPLVGKRWTWFDSIVEQSGLCRLQEAHLQSR